jgi:unsaturated rhamnogalacturonyl hydrolase
MKCIARLLFVVLMVAPAQAGCGRNAGPDTIPSTASWSRRIADSFVSRHPGAVTYDSGSPDQKWNYEQGLMLVALHQMSLHTGDQTYFDFVCKNLDQYVGENGAIRTYKLSDYNLDNVGPGRVLLAVYQATREERFRAAADTLRRQLREQPRTHEGGFWHKKIYPYQMWLDGLFMAEPFYARYAVMFNEPCAFDDIANQFIWIARHTRDPKTGLFYHAWDESKQQRWANPETGCSSNFWGRAMGWYVMALVDVLDYFPLDHPQREDLISILRELCATLLKFRDEKTSLWYQVVDQGQWEGNYLESSASCMFAYAFAKGANKGYLNRKFIDAAEQTFKGLTERQVTIEGSGFVDLHGTCRGAGLGGNPYRDGSFEYYISEPQRTNDMKGIGSFLLAAIELEKGRVTKNTSDEKR